MERAFGFLLIAEVKPISPSGWRSESTWEELFELACKSPADMIAVHTEAPWGGSLELLQTACERTGKAVLAKGIHPEDEMITAALAAGATYALVGNGRVPGIRLSRCFLEPSSLSELREMPPDAKLVWNSRDLLNLSIERFKTETFEEARALWPGLLYQASNIRTADDIHPLADGVLVGKCLPEFLETYR